MTSSGKLGTSCVGCELTYGPYYMAWFLPCVQISPPIGEHIDHVINVNNDNHVENVYLVDHIDYFDHVSHIVLVDNVDHMMMLTILKRITISILVPMLTISILLTLDMLPLYQLLPWYYYCLCWT